MADNKKTGARDDRVWKALADLTRRGLLDLLADGPKTTGELVSRFPALCRTAVMKHLDILVGAGLVLVRREGRVRWNHLNPVPIQRVCDRWVSRHVRKMSSALNRLKAIVETPLDPKPGGTQPSGAQPCGTGVPRVERGRVRRADLIPRSKPKSTSKRSRHARR